MVMVMKRWREGAEEGRGREEERGAMVGRRVGGR